jgi:hypothetical protein
MTTEVGKPAPSGDHALRVTTTMFLNIEHGIYAVLGIVLALTALLTLADTIRELWSAIVTWSMTDTILVIVDRLLVVLMLAEILHTVRVSLSSGVLSCEPFLIVGLIASIRRVLVITLESAQADPTQGPENSLSAAFQSSMIELGVLAGLILIMVVSIYLMRRSGESTAPTENS